MLRSFVRALFVALALCAVTAYAAIASAMGPVDDGSPKAVTEARAMIWLEVFNSADAAKLKYFFEHNLSAAALAERPAEARVARHLQMHGDLGTLKAVSWDFPNASTVRLSASSERRGAVTIEFHFEPNGEQLLEGLGIELGGGGPSERAASAPAPARTPEATAAAIRALCDSLARTGEFSGAVLAVKDGRTLVEQAWGLADRRTGEPNRVDTRFNLGSIGKIFTKTAIAQLAQAGKLRLDDTIDRWITELPREITSRVTVRQLVEHRSGLGDFFGAAYERADRAKILDNADYVPLFAAAPLEFEPGARERYSNAGYVVLGLIVERASGERYYDYVAKHVFAPAGMRDTGWFPRDEATPRRAVGWIRDGDSLRSNRDELPGRGSAAGGCYSTLRDLERFTLALRDHRLLGGAWTAWMTEDREPGANAAASARDERAHGALGIAGGTGGVNAVLEFDLDAGTCVVVLANLDPPSAERLGPLFARWLSATTGKAPPSGR